MPRPQGLAKTGGRKKGSLNKRTLVRKEVTEALGVDVPQRLAELLPQLEPEKQADVLLELLSYIYPKRKAIEHSGPEGMPIQIRDSDIQIRAIISNPDAFAAALQLEKAVSQNGKS